jgi:hypothetical protein
MNARTTLVRRNPKENRTMKKLIPLMFAMALTFGAVTAFSSPAPQKSTKSTKKSSSKPKATKPAK